MNITKNTIVTLSYCVTTPEGAVVDKGEAPLQYLHGGYDDIFAKLEAALDGQQIGTTLRVTLDPADAFGEYDAALLSVESLASFEKPPYVGAQFEPPLNGQDHLFRVTEITDDKVVVDGNHPLAGMALVFSATVTALRPATREEIAAKAK